MLTSGNQQKHAQNLFFNPNPRRFEPIQNEPSGVITTLLNLDTTPGTLNDLDYLSKGLSLC